MSHAWRSCPGTARKRLSVLKAFSGTSERLQALSRAVSGRLGLRPNLPDKCLTHARRCWTVPERACV
eukprot:2220003-Alexandrium_andersonii.AAC.1